MVVGWGSYNDGDDSNMLARLRLIHRQQSACSRIGDRDRKNKLGCRFIYKIHNDEKQQSGNKFCLIEIEKCIANGDE